MIFDGAQIDSTSDAAEVRATEPFADSCPSEALEEGATSKLNHNPAARHVHQLLVARQAPLRRRNAAEGSACRISGKEC